MRLTRRVGKPGNRIGLRFTVPITIRETEGYGAKVTGPAACRKKLAGRGVTHDFWGMVEGKTAEVGLPLGGKSGPWCKGTYKVDVAWVSGGKRYAPFGTATFIVR